MTTRTPQPSQQAKILRSFFASQGIQVRHTVALEAIARVAGYASTQAMRALIPDDDELAAYLEEAQQTALHARGAAPASPEAIRTALANVCGFKKDNSQSVDFASCVVIHEGDGSERRHDYSGFTLTVCFESDVEKSRIAPFAYYARRLNTIAEDWTDQPVSAAHDTVIDIKVKVLLKAIKQAGVELTAVYDESPSRAVD
jgi:hypothetical protein